MLAFVSLCVCCLNFCCCAGFSVSTRTWVLRFAALERQTVGALLCSCRLPALSPSWHDGTQWRALRSHSPPWCFPPLCSACPPPRASPIWSPTVCKAPCSALPLQPACPAFPAPLQRLSTSLYVSDLVTQFAKQLGVKALHYDSFEKVLAGELKQQACTCCSVGGAVVFP